MANQQQQRLGKILAHVSSDAAAPSLHTQSVAALRGKSPDDVVIVAAVRTAIGKAGKGGFRETTPDDLLKVGAQFPPLGFPRELSRDRFLVRRCWRRA